MTQLALDIIAENKAKHARGEDASYLDLGNCDLTELPNLSGMDWVETLILSNVWWEYDDLKKQWFKLKSKNNRKSNLFKKNPISYPHLPLLKKLVASGLGIIADVFLEKLTKLTSLDLSSNPISDFSFLEKLTELNTLNIRGNQISDWRFLEKLTTLNALDLSDNQISNISFLEKLTELNALDLSDNQISNISFLEKLTKLNTLDLSDNQISNISFLEKLTELNTLDLSFNKISDISFLDKMTALNTLDLRGNQISDWRFLEKLTKLNTLDLSDNQISDISFLEKLTNLNTLDLSDNQISNISFLEKLSELNTLDLSNNKISDISFLEKLSELNTLDLRGNQISDIKPFLALIEKGIPVTLGEYGRGIKLRENPLTNPPIEIAEQGNAAILEYFRQKEKAGIKPLLEAKMVLLGEGRAGKTSLACRMLGKELPKQEDRTQGVDIVIGEYLFPVEEGEFVLHIWDFAGQEKYKPLHQFFYTEGAVYVLVADSGNAQTDFADWFETAEMFGGEGSPLLLALNEFREGMGMGSFDEEKWRKQFPKLIKEVRLVNLLSQKGFPALEKDIRHLANQLPHTRTEYPANWANIRSELERRRDENYISLPEYLKICRQFELPERESALILSSILHRIGVCLHYQKSDLLRQHVILKNEWATAAVYKILEDQTVAEKNKGFFDWSDLRRIWSEDSYQDMQPQLLELMCEFKMAYPLPNGKEFVTPPLLPTTSPQDWDFPEGEAIEVRVEYEFLPKALMTQFIVSRHTDIDRGRTLVWREGVVLRWSNDTLAQISKFKSRGRDAFQIRVLGGERRGLLTSILKTLRDLHEEYRGIRAHEIVPCPCEGCRAAQNAQHYFEFKNLINRLEKGRRVVECDQSLEEVDLLKILGDLLLFERLGVGEVVVLAKSEKNRSESGLTDTVITTIRKKLKKDRLEEALAYLETHAPMESILLQAQIARAAKNTQQGLEGAEQESAIRQRTIKAVLAWLEDL